MKAFRYSSASELFEKYPNVTEHQIGGGLWVISHNLCPVTYVCQKGSPIYLYIRAVEREETNRLSVFYPKEDIENSAVFLRPLKMSDLDYVPSSSLEDEDTDPDDYEEDILSEEAGMAEGDSAWSADEPEPPPNKLELFLESTAGMIYKMWGGEDTPKEKNDKEDIERNIGTHIKQDAPALSNRNFHVSFKETEAETSVDMTPPTKAASRLVTEGWWLITKPSVITCYKISATLNIQTAGLLSICHKNAISEANPKWLRSFYTSMEEYLTHGLDPSKASEFMENLTVVLKFALAQEEDSGVREPASNVLETLISPMADVNRNQNK